MANIVSGFLLVLALNCLPWLSQSVLATPLDHSPSWRDLTRQTQGEILRNVVGSKRELRTLFDKDLLAAAGVKNHFPTQSHFKERVRSFNRWVNWDLNSATRLSQGVIDAGRHPCWFTKDGVRICSGTSAKILGPKPSSKETELELISRNLGEEPFKETQEDPLLLLLSQPLLSKPLSDGIEEEKESFRYHSLSQ